MTEALLDVRDLKKYFSLGTGFDLKAVDGVSFTINKGETFGLVGESGCGKSTLGRTIIRLYDHTDGEVLFKGKNVHQLRGKEAGQFNRDAQMIFQDPQASLNPRMTVEDIIAEGLDIHHLNSGMRRERVAELLHLVGLHKDHAQRFPHEFSGGQRQRIGIARALAVEPEFIIADEPISALDVSIQAQVVNLLEDLQHDRGLTYLFIAHDLSMVKHISNRIGVMYLGKMVELASSYELYTRPLHPYTQALLSSVPVPDPTVKRERIVLQGDLPSPANKPSGCGFRTRCPLVQPRCAEEVPKWQEAQPGHWLACHLIES
ncbi:ABC transporter ATP-binding protein [Brevibacillus porteri]|uniref:Oligopeptide ABC transporter ATP-binding protein OppF n=1 Tax=Brevibacillus porteri TaxID=2126350 RepID=A0ABX5FUW7_9BACL|nr:oligopeptide/dipeptide ABC transporter ATP-binding protein [Brevibacillus porteri]MED1799040.1 ATP-binding cassette domain-containing protein [Brevibacillus porteri]MED2130052.1 ATP-binding cassette domain-containing protein [Brevibacillus porteri]MED2746590.1 ATP-binding cassette domain-containing protein [Brevibacillus porteri]MED2814571.1 ATP-binding cassette domain-containing protein [Brevibacillus porteri]MED2894580.1 ATP-binding cassette domain-containing protein [Brevibacillus porter